MRSLLLFIALVVLYYALKTAVRSAFKAYGEDGGRARGRGEEMIFDPQCRTYILKERAVTRRIHGSAYSFCSDDCAQKYEKAHRR